MTITEKRARLAKAKIVHNEYHIDDNFKINCNVCWLLCQLALALDVVEEAVEICDSICHTEPHERKKLEEALTKFEAK